MKRLITALFILVFSPIPLSANVKGFYQAVSISISPYFGISHFEDEVPARTSIAESASLGLLGYQSKAWTTSLELQAQSVSQSLPYGTWRSRAFTSYGIALHGGYAFTHLFTLFGQVGTQINHYSLVDSAFASFSVQVGAQFQLAASRAQQLFITVPLSVHLRKEITAIQLGVGVRYHFFPPYFGGPR